MNTSCPPSMMEEQIHFLPISEEVPLRVISLAMPMCHFFRLWDTSAHRRPVVTRVTRRRKYQQKNNLCPPWDGEPFGTALALTSGRLAIPCHNGGVD